jgi:FdhE protein
VTRSRDSTGWDARIARARELAREVPAAREPLTFFAELATYQRSLFLAARDVPVTGQFRDDVDVDGASAAVPGFLAWLARAAPAPLARSAGAIRADSLEWRGLMREGLMLDEAGLEAGRDDTRAFVMAAVLQPFAEAAAIARRGELVSPSVGPGAFTSRCPICSGLPSVGVLREEGQGAKRMLVCSRCLSEWSYVRVVCPGCGEEGFDALPVYTADAFPHVRIEACDSCTRYVKTIDLTRNGLAVPVVDDIASLTLDLWAAEQGYRRLRVNLLRTDEPARR